MLRPATLRRNTETLAKFHVNLLKLGNRRVGRKRRRPFLSRFRRNKARRWPRNNRSCLLGMQSAVDGLSTSDGRQAAGTAVAPTRVRSQDT